MRDIIGTIVIIIGVIFVAIGVVGIYRFKNFYSRILIASKIDTVGFLTIVAGVVIKKGFSWFSLKVILVTVIVMIINPVVTHAIARSAYHGGYRIDKSRDEEKKKND